MWDRMRTSSSLKPNPIFAEPDTQPAPLRAQFPAFGVQVTHQRGEFGLSLGHLRVTNVVARSLFTTLHVVNYMDQVMGIRYGQRGRF